LGRYLLAFALLLASSASTADPGAASMRHKLDSLRSGHLRAGSVVVFTSAEINAWARHELPTTVPEGVRQPRVELASGAATGYALIDFVKLRHAQGRESNWLVRKLIEGEKPVKVNARIQSAHGKATVYLQRVEIGGLAVSGYTLDFMIETFFLPLYPNAKINQPFELNDNVDRLEVHPGEARVFVTGRPPTSSPAHPGSPSRSSGPAPARRS
jgi:hypothetical protein